MPTVVTLDTFPTELLRLIFEFCDGSTLARLCKTCHRFQEILTDDSLWSYAAQSVIGCNIQSNVIRDRSLVIEGNRERCRLSHNWQIGKYEETVYRFCHNRQRTKFMPWLWMEADRIWCTKGNTLEVYKRHKYGHVAQSPITHIMEVAEDLSRFVIKDGKVFCGGRNGGLFAWDASTFRLIFSAPRSHIFDVHDVDFTNGILLSGSRDMGVKLWKMSDKGIEAAGLVMAFDRILCVAACEDLWCFGTSAIKTNRSLVVYDLLTVNLVACMKDDASSRLGAGLLDVHWLTPQTILSCGYDSSLKLWDVRTTSCVSTWEDPHDTSLYSLACDGSNTVICGTSRHCRAQMWDLRQKQGVQMYFGQSPHSSPVYSLSFDTNCLYLALDETLNYLDFTTKDAIPHNFKLQE